MRLEVETPAPIKDPWGNTRAAATRSGKLNHKDWCLDWNKALEFGEWMVGRRGELHVRRGGRRAVPAGAR